MTKRAIHYNRKKYVRRDPPYQRSAGHELTERLPELAALADVVGAPVVLDGELVAGQGRSSDFYAVWRDIRATGAIACRSTHNKSGRSMNG